MNVSAGGNGPCNVPSCRPRPQAVSASANTQASAQDAGGRETEPTAQPENSFGFAFLVVRLGDDLL